MAINTAELRRSISGLPFLTPGVTPNIEKDIEWRKQSGWNYSGTLLSNLGSFLDGVSADCLIGESVLQLEIALPAGGLIGDSVFQLKRAVLARDLTGAANRFLLGSKAASLQGCGTMQLEGAAGHLTGSGKWQVRGTNDGQLVGRKKSYFERAQ